MQTKPNNPGKKGSGTNQAGSHNSSSPANGPAVNTDEAIAPEDDTDEEAEQKGTEEDDDTENKTQHPPKMSSH